MSSGGPSDDAEDLARVLSGESFDAREQVKSEAAYELHCRATADSAVYDHPGFVPDAYLDGLGTGTAVMAAELCSACGAPATRIELVAPGQLPAQWEHWPPVVRDSFLRHRGPVVPDR